MNFLVVRYSTIGSWDAGVTCALAQLHSEMGDAQTAKHHYQDVSIRCAFQIH